MQGGCDAIAVPSRFEPCGLTQLYGLRYGCVPIVARTGGLADTVIDANEAAIAAGAATGFLFEPGQRRGAAARCAPRRRLPSRSCRLDIAAEAGNEIGCVVGPQRRRNTRELYQSLLVRKAA